MALIGQIRKRSWILIVFISIGLGGFIFMDYSSAQNRGGGAAQNVLGVVNGEKVERQEFETAYNLLYNGSSGDVNGQRAYLWNYMVEEKIIRKESAKLGLGVSRDELKDLEFGTNLSPSITQRFRGQNGQVDRAQLNNIKQIIESGTINQAIEDGQLSRQFIPLWAQIEQEVIKNRLQSKIDKLVEKAMYTPSWMAEMGFQEQNQFVDFTYVKVPYDDITPADANVTDADYAAYVSDNAERFRQKEASRVLNFVTFTVTPSEKDRAAIKANLAELIDGFTTAEKDSSFVIKNGGGSMDPAYVKKDKIAAAIKDTLFALPVGSVYGPYEEAGRYKLVKVQGRKMIPDSVKSRHILKRVQSYAQLQQANKTLDSLRTLIQNGSFTFDSLAVKFSADGSASKGGDLGYIALNGMVKPFNDLIFYEAEIGELKIIQSQFGVHLVEVTDRKYINNEEGLRLAYLSEDIIPSADTRSDVYGKATAMAGENSTVTDLAKAIEGIANLKLETTPALKANDYSVGTLGSIDDARTIVKWAFKTNVGSVSPDVYIFKDPTFAYDNKYVVVGVKAVQQPGIPSAENIKNQIETAVLNKKRSSFIMKQIAGMDMAAVAARYNVPVDTANRVSFSQIFGGGNLGSEPSVIASAFTVAQGGTTSAIEGKTGVFMVNVLSKPAAPAPTGLSQVRKTMTASTLRLVFNQPGSASQLLQNMVKKADVEDSRSVFY